MADLPVRVPWYVRFLPATWQRGYYPAEERPKVISLGADYAADTLVTSPTAAQDLAAMAVFPWVFACVRAMADDLSGVPLVIQRGEGKAAQVVDVPDLAALLKQPSTTIDGIQFRRQLVTDLATGNAFAALAFVGRTPRSMMRLHPSRVRVEPDEYDGIASYQYVSKAGDVGYAPSAMLHVRFPSWQEGVAGLLGTGALRALERTLSAEFKAEQLAVVAAGSGRPSVILSPADGMSGWTEQLAAAIVEKWNRLLSQNGVIATPKPLKVDIPTFNPRDLEFKDLRTVNRESILAVFGVPPTRVGLPTANYATAEQQAEVYWTNLVSLAALLDAQLTRVARYFGRDLSVHHDFSSVPALQNARDRRLARIKQWVDLGAPVAAAAAYEGFDDAPVPATEATPTPPAPPAKRIKRLTVEADRAAVSKAWISTVHAPAERRMLSIVRDALAAQADRCHRRALDFAKSAPAAVTKDIADAVMSAIFPAGVEDAALADAIRGAIREAVRTGWQAGLNQLAHSSLADGRIDTLTERQIADMVTHINATTRDSLATTVRLGLASGKSTADIAADIQASAAFSPSRALAISRTETTRAVNGGTVAAYEDAAASGVRCRKEWLSARDSEVRDTHMLLDGQVVDPGDLFVVPSGEYAGHSASAPGGFSAAALCVNCRCTVLPVLED